MATSKQDICSQRDVGQQSDNTFSMQDFIVSVVTEEQEKEQRKSRSKEVNIITETGESGAVKRRDGAEKGLQMERPKPGDPA